MRQRWEEREAVKECAVDIDGVLNYYPVPWVDWLNSQEETRPYRKTGKESGSHAFIDVRTVAYPFKDLNQAKKAIPYQLYKDLKWKYRESGAKERLKARFGADELTVSLSRRGFVIVLLTARPFHTHRTLLKQTMTWLDKSGIVYDDIISGDDKISKVVSLIPHLRFAIEDHRYWANALSKWGYTCFLVDNQYNQGEIGDKVIRVEVLSEVLKHVDGNGDIRRSG